MMRLPAFALWLLMLAPAAAQKHILHVGHSAGFRHDSVVTSARVLQNIGERTGKFQVTATEDLSYITASRLSAFDAVFFFTSGELALRDDQKRDLLEFVQSGKGFGGAHSATDTLYLWPEYGDLIGGYFDDHPWAKEVSIDVEDPDFPGLKDAGPSFRVVEEIYQFRAFSRERVRVLTTLDTSTVDLTLPNVRRTDGDFALSWVRRYGEGRVFYTALGHFDETWLDERFQKQLEGALLWLIGEAEGEGRPRPVIDAPAIAAVQTPTGKAESFAPGSVISIVGERLTSGSTLAARESDPRLKLAGTRVELNGAPLPLFSVSPDLVTARLPAGLAPGAAAELRVARVGAISEPVSLTIVETAPALMAVRQEGTATALYATGLAAQAPVARVNGQAVRVRRSGIILPGVWRIEIEGVPSGATVDIRAGTVVSNALVID